MTVENYVYSTNLYLTCTLWAIFNENCRIFSQQKLCDTYLKCSVKKKKIDVVVHKCQPSTYLQSIYVLLWDWKYSVFVFENASFFPALKVLLLCHSSMITPICPSSICVLQLGQLTSSGEAEPSSHIPGHPMTGRAHGQTGWQWASARSWRKPFWSGWRVPRDWEIIWSCT